MQDPRDEFIARVSQGQSFIDVGGLFEIVKERITAAHRAGARRLALLDLESDSCPWWNEMRRHLDANGVGPCEFISADILKADIEAFDIVHSSGVLYHMPCPISYIQKLRSMTSKFCILTSTIIQERLVGAGSDLTFPDGAVLFVPALKEREKEIVTDWFLRKGYGDISSPASAFGPMNYFRNWFIPTVSAFKTMAVLGGFEIVDESEVDKCAYTLMLKPV